MSLTSTSPLASAEPATIPCGPAWFAEPATVPHSLAWALPADFLAKPELADELRVLPADKRRTRLLSLVDEAIGDCRP